LGATHTINTNDADPIQDLIQEVKGVTGGEGTSITIDTTGVPKLIEDGVQFTARRGQFFFIGIPPPTTMLPVDVRSMIGVSTSVSGNES
jgi:Zn-dependent alcohol dehydrogenase